jgi:AraC-like DNA-binding protein
MQIPFPRSMSSIDVSLLRYVSTTYLPPQDQFEAWRDLMAEFIDFLPAPGCDTYLPAEFNSWNFGGITFTRALLSGASARQWRHRPRSLLDYWCVVLVRSAANDEACLTLAGSSINNLSFRSLAMPFEGSASDTEVLTLFLPWDQSGDEARAFERAHDRDLDPALAALLADYMNGLALQLRHMPAEHAQRLAPVTRSLVAACVTPSVDRAEAAEAPIASHRLDRARHVVRQNMASPEFGPHRLCSLLAMSRSKLYRLFEKSGGIAHFINGERLREAHRRLSDPFDMPSIQVVANDVGFADHSTFSRAFRREFGYSPSEARERALGRPLTYPRWEHRHDCDFSASI